jgi:hypothetical protein
VSAVAGLVNNPQYVEWFGVHTAARFSRVNSTPTGTDSKAGTVLHEHTHSDASTDDNVYRQAGSRALAINDAGRATENADSHEYYAGG